MTGEQYREAIKTLGLSQVAAGKLLEANPRSSRRWAAEGPPAIVAILLRVMIGQGLKPDDVERMKQ